MMRRLHLELKSLKVYFLVPFFVLFVLVPLTILATVRTGGRFGECIMISQLFIPGLAAWWPLFVAKEYLNSPGKELLFVYGSRANNLLNKMIILWLFFALNVVIIFLFYTFLFDCVWFLFIAVIIQSTFMIALSYLLSLLLQNTFVPLIIDSAYSSVFLLSPSLVYYSPLSIFEVNTLLGHAGDLRKAPFVAVSAFVLFYVGFQIEKRLYRDSI